MIGRDVTSGNSEGQGHDTRYGCPSGTNTTVSSGYAASDGRRGRDQRDHSARFGEHHVGGVHFISTNNTLTSGVRYPMHRGAVVSSSATPGLRRDTSSFDCRGMTLSSI